MSVVFGARAFPFAVQGIQSAAPDERQQELAYRASFLASLTCAVAVPDHAVQVQTSPLPGSILAFDLIHPLPSEHP